LCSNDTGSPWQVVLFKRVKDGETVEISLRLVGFPEGIEFLHPERLTITTAKGQILAAEDAFAQESPALNVGQYNMQDILTQLPVTEAIRAFPTPRQSPLSQYPDSCTFRMAKSAFFRKWGKSQSPAIKKLRITLGLFYTLFITTMPN
jgi:hypothetical protein